MPPLQPMLDRIAHRGPQGAGVHRSETAVFAAQRLAIRGLEDGVQPIVDLESGVVAVCNGEIDNHADLRSQLAKRGRIVAQATDIAVIPALYLEYGDDFVQMLEGAFALAVWDPGSNIALFARDRAGERPLFYRWDGHTLSFASEVAALAGGEEGRLTPDSDAISKYLETGSLQAPASPLLDIRKLGPGEQLKITADGIEKKRYWRWAVAESAKRSGNIDEFDRVFRSAIAKQSNIDVPYGVFLSGGVDSSLIAAVLRSVRPESRPRCYTLRFSEDSYDEGVYAERIAKQLGYESISVNVTPELFMSELPGLVSMAGEPLADPAWIPTALLSRRAARDVRLVFGGEGGDELFGGYPTYLGAKLAGYYRALPIALRTSLANVSAKMPVSDRKMPLSYLLKRFTEADNLPPLARHARWNAPLSPAVMRDLGLQPTVPDDSVGGSIIDRLQRYDLETGLAEGLLTKADRGGMNASLEIRAPFLDRDVMEYAATLTLRDRIKGLETKSFLKRYAAKYLPNDIVYRRKRGLSIPLAAWLRGPMQQWATQRLAGDRLGEVGVNPAAARGLFAQHLSRREDHAKAIWALLVLDEWLRWKSGTA